MRSITCGIEKRAGPTSMTLASLCAALIGALNALTYMKIYHRPTKNNNSKSAKKPVKRFLCPLLSDFKMAENEIITLS